MLVIFFKYYSFMYVFNFEKLNFLNIKVIWRLIKHLFKEIYTQESQHPIVILHTNHHLFKNIICVVTDDKGMYHDANIFLNIGSDYIKKYIYCCYHCIILILFEFYTLLFYYLMSSTLFWIIFYFHMTVKYFIYTLLHLKTINWFTSEKKNKGIA